MVIPWIAVVMVYLHPISLSDPALLDHQAASLVPHGTVAPLFGLSVVLTIFLLVVTGFFAGHGSPSFAGPVAGLGLRSGIVAVVASTEVLAATGDVLLDRHVGIPETDDLGLLSVLDAHG
jgi:hypothetical protein